MKLVSYSIIYIRLYVCFPWGRYICHILQRLENSLCCWYTHLLVLGMRLLCPIILWVISLYCWLYMHILLFSYENYSFLGTCLVFCIVILRIKIQLFFVIFSKISYAEYSILGYCCACVTLFPFTSWLVLYLNFIIDEIFRWF